MAELEELQAEVGKWKGKAEEAETLAADAIKGGASSAAAKVKDLAKKNRDLSVKLNRAQDELIQAKSGSLGGSGSLAGTGTPTYSQHKAQAKADTEAVAEIAKYKRLYTAGAERLGRLQQENENLRKDVASLQSAKKELQGKVALLEDQIKSSRTSESPERGTKRGKGQGEERGGLIWKTRHQELSEKMEALEADHEKTRLAAEAALARRTILEQEMKQLRNRIRELLEKSAMDDVLIGAMSAERAAQTAGHNGERVEEQALRDTISLQEQQIDRQEKIIAALQRDQGEDAPPGFESAVLAAGEDCSVHSEDHQVATD